MCFHFPISTEYHQLRKAKDVLFRHEDVNECALVRQWKSLTTLCVMGTCFSQVEPRSGIPRSGASTPWIFIGAAEEPSKAVLVDLSPHPTHRGYEECLFGWLVGLVWFYSLRKKNDVTVWFSLAIKAMSFFLFCEFSVH